MEGISGPGKVAKTLGIDRSFYGEKIPSERLWLESDGTPPPPWITTPRIGIDYAEEWKDMPWRFVDKKVKEKARKGKCKK